MPVLKISGILLILTLVSPRVNADNASSKVPANIGTKVIDSIETRMRGKGSRGVMRMYIKKWNRTMRMKFWEIYPDKSLIKLLSPAEDAGKGSLKLGKDMWAYDPHIDQIQRIPPSLMMDAWMGSDFTNDDVSRSSSIRLDYNIGRVTSSKRGKTATWRVVLTPKPNSPVVWDKMIIEAAQDDFRPLRQEYYNEKGKIVRALLFRDYRKLDDGRVYPFVWRMDNLLEKGRYTEIRVLKLKFTDSISKRRFTIRALKSGR